MSSNKAKHLSENIPKMTEKRCRGVVIGLGLEVPKKHYGGQESSF